MASRKPLIVANWKMNTTPNEGEKLAQTISEGVIESTHILDVVICPPFTGIMEVRSALSETRLSVGAQTASAANNTALTGEISVAILSQMVTHVIIGHSERRTILGESDKLIATKAIALGSVDLTSILCIGESIDQRQAGHPAKDVVNQLNSSLDGFENWDRLVVAYEPLWAIGTGIPASPLDVQDITYSIRDGLRKLAGGKRSGQIKILYGGSVHANNIGKFMEQNDVDGTLVGSASLKPSEFIDIVNIAARYS